MARFYGWTDKDIDSMEAQVFDMYFSAIEGIEASEAIRQIQVISYPHMKNQAQEKVYSSFLKQYRNMFDRSDEQPLSTAAIVGLLNRG